MSSITKENCKKINLVRFMKLSFISEYVLKIWFGIAASDQGNRLQTFISQSRSMLVDAIREAIWEANIASKQLIFL